RGDIPILVGGSGERKTLRLVAKYADGCNCFGGPDQFRHLMGVLDRHCEDVGRDPREITRTGMGTLLIGADDAEAQRKLEALKQRGVPERVLAGAIAGTPERVTELVQERVDAGLEGITITMP